MVGSKAIPPKTAIAASSQVAGKVWEPMRSADDQPRSDFGMD
jgi:hypothetical protein